MLLDYLNALELGIAEAKQRYKEKKRNRPAEAFVGYG
jgi:hypothetical protein